MTSVQILIIVAVIVLLIGRRLAGQELQLRRVIVLPVILGVLGVGGLDQAVHHPGSTDIGLLVLSLAVSLIFGLLRGRTIEISTRGGTLWYRYRASTVAWWIGALAARLGLGAVEHAAGAGHLLTSSLMLGLAATLLGEAAVIYPRATRLSGPGATRSYRANCQDG